MWLRGNLTRDRQDILGDIACFGLDAPPFKISEGVRLKIDADFWFTGEL